VRLGWATAGLLCALIIAWRFEPTVDLAWFLPEPENQAEQVLLERLGQGPGSQLLFVAIQANDTADLLVVSQNAVEQLTASGQFSRVVNGHADLAEASMPAVIHGNRYLLADIALDDATLRAALRARIGDLGAFMHPAMLSLLAEDPTMATLQVLEGISPVAANGLQWLDGENNAAYLVAETHASAFDLAGQTEAIAAIQAVQLPGVTAISLHGVGVYGVELQDTIRSEATLRSVLATLVIIFILVIAYRRFSVVLLGLLPLLLGGLAGLATIVLLFPKVHGITLAFGFTLLGVAIDYPLHFLSHSRTATSAAELKSVWLTMRLGVVSTAAVFLAIAAGGSAGLAQMGVFSATGIVVAYFATRSLLPALSPLTASDGAVAGTPVDHALRNWLWAPLLLVLSVAMLTLAGPRWMDDLSAVSPIDPEKIIADQELRARLGAPDIRSLITIRGTEFQPLLEQTELLAAELESLVGEGALDGYQSSASLVPSEKMQLARRQRLAAAENLATRVQTLALEEGFRANSFAPFIEAVNAAATGDQVVTPALYQDTEFASVLASSLYQQGDEWVSTVALFAISDREKLIQRLAVAVPDAVFVDLKDASNALMTRYRLQVTEMVVLALLVIATFLLWSLRDLRRVIWVLGTLSAALLFTLFVSNLLLGSLSIFNLIAAVLVAGLGMDYALFCARQETSMTAADNTRHAVAVCAISTCAAFTVLAFSAIPVLQSIGVTVAIGVAASYGLARFGQRPVR
jgi:predicted exporter